MANSKFAGLAEIKRNSGTPAMNNRTGRPKTGMRSNPDYRSFNYFIRKDTHHRVFAILHETGTTFSELTNQLMEKWLEDQQKKGKG